MEQPLTGECGISPKNNIPRQRAEKPQQDSRRGEITVRIKPHTCQRCLEGSEETCATGEPADAEPGLPLGAWVSPAEAPVSSGRPQGQGLWVQQTWVWHKPFWRRAPLTTHSCQTYTWLGKQTHGGHKQNLVCTRTHEKGAVTLQDIDPDLPVSVQEYPAEAWVSGGLLQGQGHWVQHCVHGAFWRRLHYLHYLHHSLFSGQTKGREHSPAHQQKVWLNSLNIFPQMWNQIIW